MSGEFEFGEQESKTFGDAGYWMGIVGRIWMFFGGLGLIAGVLYAISSHGNVGLVLQSALQGVLGLVVGYWTATAAKGFREVDSTQGRDVSHLTSAAENLAKVYRLQAVLIGLACAFVIIAMASSAFALPIGNTAP